MLALAAGYRSALLWLPVLHLAGFSSRPQVSNIIAATAEHCWLVCLKEGYRSAILLLPMLHPAAFPTRYRSAALSHLGLLALALPLATPLAPGPSPQASMWGPAISTTKFHRLAMAIWQCLETRCSKQKIFSWQGPTNKLTKNTSRVHLGATKRTST